MTRAERRFYRAVLISFVAFWLTACLLYSNLYAQIGPIVIPTPTMLPAPTPQDGDNFLIMTPVQYLPLLQNGGAHE